MSPLRLGDGRRLLAFTGREWVVADGRGGYAHGTHAGLATRKYHGLLVVARPAPVGRLLLVARVEDTLVVDGEEIPLDTSCYEPGVLHPEGFRHQVAFAARPVPTWTYAVAGRRLVKSLHLSRQGEGVRVTWELVEGDAAAIRVRPLLTRRSHHAVARSDDFDPVVERVGASSVRWRPRAGDPATVVSVDGVVVDDQAWWYRDTLYPVEQDRGYDAIEDLHAPCRFELSLVQGEPVGMRVTAEDAPASPAPAWPAARLSSRNVVGRDAQRALLSAAESFLVVGCDGRPGIIAGYPWFEEWGRDTMLAIPGLLIATGRTGVAADMLDAWASRLRRGLLPNRLGDHHAVETNTADASLLWVRALDRLLDKSCERDASAKRFREPLFEILDRHIAGTDHGIGVDADGLLRAGAPGLALTWMDAVDVAVPVTPRRGKPIELSALWLDALHTGVMVAELLGDDALGAELRSRATATASAMRHRFLDPVSGYLRDVVDPEDGEDGDAFRPNLLFALGSSHHPFTRDEAERNLARVDVDLRVATGLRTLSPTHPSYQGRYAGDQSSRDRAYHQGTVWPWLLGPWADAVLRVRGDGERSRATILDALEGSLRFVVDHGSLPEVFDGDDAHVPGGCPAQAWSVAEVLRVFVRATS